MSERTGEGNARRVSDFQIFDSSSEGEDSDIPVREVTEESPYEQSENSSSVGAAGPSDEVTPTTVENTQEEVTEQEETAPTEQPNSQEETVPPEEETAPQEEEPTSPGEETSPERSIEVVELDRTSSQPRDGGSSSTDDEFSGWFLFSALFSWL